VEPRGAEGGNERSADQGRREPTVMRRTITQSANICCKLDHSTAQVVENSEEAVTVMVPDKGGDE
jgi:hypothetical protein